jgi:hypothetical protein
MTFCQLIQNRIVKSFEFVIQPKNQGNQFFVFTKKSYRMCGLRELFKNIFDTYKVP